MIERRGSEGEEGGVRREEGYARERGGRVKVGEGSEREEGE